MAEIRASAERVAAKLRGRFAGRVELVECASRIGSGALPVDTRPSAGIALRPRSSTGGRSSGRRVEELAAALRALPLPVVGRIREGALVLDLRCLERDGDLVEALAPLLRDEPPGDSNGGEAGGTHGRGAGSAGRATGASERPAPR